MSSSAYSVCLTPDPWLQIVVRISGQLLAAAGLSLILLAPIDAGARSITGVIWLFFCCAELRRLDAGHRRLQAIRLLPSGDAFVRTHDTQWVAATLLDGSVLLGHWGWIRLQAADGRRFQELIRGDRRQSHEWRRLQVIWRHIGAAF